jgi:hypothetical protein
MPPRLRRHRHVAWPSWCPCHDPTSRATLSCRCRLALVFPRSTSSHPQRPTVERSNEALGDDSPIPWSTGRIGGGEAREDINFSNPVAATRFNQARRRGWSDWRGGPLHVGDEVQSRRRTMLFPHCDGVRCTGRTRFSSVDSAPRCSHRN